MAQKGYKLTADSARLVRDTVKRVARLPADERGRAANVRRTPPARSVLPIRVTSATANSAGLYPAVWLRYKPTDDPPAEEQDVAVYAVSLAGASVSAGYYHGIRVGTHADGVAIFDVIACC